MSDFTRLISALAAELATRLNLIGRRQVIVVAAAGAGAGRRITYKMHAGDSATYTAAALDSYTNPAAGEAVWLDTFAGDSLIIGRVG